MRKEVPEKLERGRVRRGPLVTTSDDGFYGAFEIAGPCGAPLRIVSSLGGEPIAQGWEHVSVSTPWRPPNWEEMCAVKTLCWYEDECVVQFHPPRAAYVNNHPHCLHLWKPPYAVVLPPEILIGIKAAGENIGPEKARALQMHLWKL
jgi:hypothetical protein